MTIFLVKQQDSTDNFPCQEVFSSRQKKSPLRTTAAEENSPFGFAKEPLCIEKSYYRELFGLVRKIFRKKDQRQKKTALWDSPKSCFASKNYVICNFLLCQKNVPQKRPAGEENSSFGFTKEPLYVKKFRYRELFCPVRKMFRKKDRRQKKTALRSSPESRF